MDKDDSWSPYTPPQADAAPDVKWSIPRRSSPQSSLDCCIYAVLIAATHFIFRSFSSGELDLSDGKIEFDVAWLCAFFMVPAMFLELSKSYRLANKPVLPEYIRSSVRAGLKAGLVMGPVIFLIDKHSYFIEWWNDGLAGAYNFSADLFVDTILLALSISLFSAILGVLTFLIRTSILKVGYRIMRS